MCGLVLLAGHQAGQNIEECIERIQHRGPDVQSILADSDFAIGFQRLVINGSERDGQQPFEKDGWLSAINGEIYNYRELAEKYQIDVSDCDTDIVLPLYLRLAENVIEELDGFYSGVLINPERTQAFCLRDPMGKKPLFVGVSEDIVFITSELKAFKSIDWFKSLPKGVSTVDLSSGKIHHTKFSVDTHCNTSISQALTESVRKRLPKKQQSVAVFLSGGLDSSIVASISSRFREDITYFTLGDEEAQDAIAAQVLVKFLGLKKVVKVPLPEHKELPELISQIVRATESYNPSVVSNGLATFLLARATNQAGIKVVLTGEGADELFGGYHAFRQDEPWKETRERLISDMTFTELRRLDMACMANSVEPRCPFLDKSVKALSDQMQYEDLYNDDMNKVALRKAFSDLLPPEILKRKKTSCDVGSGIRAMVVLYLTRNGRTEREELLDIWRSHFQFDASEQFFHSYPVFDVAIDNRGVAHR
jgi:asparagine synthase (glutamine-hydrolysing)